MSDTADRLRQIVDTATPGPWETAGPRRVYSRTAERYVADGWNNADTCFTAQFDPVLVTAMLDVVELAGLPLYDVRMKRALERFREAAS